jgi:hypothetical protein
MLLSLRENGIKNVSVVRKAVSGTRVLRQYNCITYQSYGLCGKNRFRHEIESVCGAKKIIIQQGINDASQEAQEKLLQQREEFDTNITAFKEQLKVEFGEEFGEEIFNNILSNDKAIEAINKKINGEDLSDEENDLITNLLGDSGSIEERLQQYEKINKAVQEYKIATNQTGKEVKSVTKITNSFVESQSQLDEILKNNTKAAFNFNAAMESQKNKIKELKNEP